MTEKDNFSGCTAISQSNNSSIKIEIQAKIYGAYFHTWIRKYKENLKISSLTLTSFKSLLASWVIGSKKFCLTLSSRAYFTSARSLNASPASTRQAPGEEKWITSYEIKMK